MMGMQTAPAQLFYDFCLDHHVPEDHLLRRIDRFLDLEKVRTELKPFYSSIGNPGSTLDSPFGTYSRIIRGTLAADDALKAQGQETRFRVRETPDWQRQAAELDRKCSSAGCFST
jgi:hypothetical protein